MARCLTFVLGGGGARGALQVGALRALFEAGMIPDLLVGTSIGAVNAASLALWGNNLEAVERMEQAWRNAASNQWLETRLSQLTLRALLGRPSERTRQRLAAFFASEGLTQDVCFGQIMRTRLAVIGADLESGRPIIYGQDPNQSILDGLFASIALPPWFAPIENAGQFVIDGGALSNLPIEPALALGATEIVALDLDDPNSIPGNERAFFHRMEQLVFALSRRHVQLETALAEARGVPVQRIELRGPTATPIWDFRSCEQLIGIGYEIATQHMTSRFSAMPAAKD